MIKENQRVLNILNVVSDGVIVYLSMPAAFFIRFYVLSGGIIIVPLSSYCRLAVGLTAAHLFTYAWMGIYTSFRSSGTRKELKKLFVAQLADMAILLSYLFVGHHADYSRLALGIFLVLSFGILGGKRVILRTVLRNMRKNGYNQKHILIIGGGDAAKKYLNAIRSERRMGYSPMGYLAAEKGEMDIPYLGTVDDLERILDEKRPDEAVSAIGAEEYSRIGQIVSTCEKTGTKLSIVPFYADYMTAASRVDEVNGLPLLNIRRVPLDNLANAFVKRLMDILGSVLLIVLFSPAMVICGVGVKLSSPGPVIFKQKRVGLNKKIFNMYKFRSMRVNGAQDTAWSKAEDPRKTKFGSFIRKYSLDELPQFFNVLKGDMSLVGPRPEIPFHVEHFKETIPLYMVKHQVRPGITGWAQVMGFRGDTSIEERIRCDIYYIEHWSLWMDMKILLLTVLGGKFKNNEKVGV